MLLEDKLYNFDKVLLVESLPFNAEIVEQQRAKAEKELNDIYEKPIHVNLVNYNNLSDGIFLNRDNSLVIFNSQSYDEDSFFALHCVLKVRRLAEKLKAESPNSDYLVLSNLGKISSDSHVRMALELILKKLDREDDGFIDHLTGDRPKFQRETLLEYLANQLGQIRHSIGGKKDAAFIRELSERYMCGNKQTSADKTFLIVSSRLEGLRGKFDVVDHYADFSSINFKKYAAILVDNNYSFKDSDESKLGSGINVVEQLTALGVRLPIVYQTAHLLQDFSDEDIKRLREFDNLLLMPKNRAFKICNPNQAIKDLAVNEITSSDEIFYRYCVHVYSIGEKGYIEHEGNAIVATDAVNNVHDTKLLIHSLGLDDNIYSHRLAVLAAFHSRMKSELGNPSFASTVDYLRPWNAIEKGLEAFGFRIEKPSETKELYSSLREKHLAESPTTIIHNDPKWDNWFKEYILGDFSDCSPGTEYKDIARALLDKETDFSLVCDNSWVDSNIETYVSARRKLDPKFKILEDFGAKVKELIFMESLRLARFEAQNNNRFIAENLLSVAKYYKEALCDSYRIIPRSGDRAPYSNLVISI